MRWTIEFGLKIWVSQLNNPNCKIWNFFTGKIMKILSAHVLWKSIISCDPGETSDASVNDEGAKARRFLIWMEHVDLWLRKFFFLNFREILCCKKWRHLGNSQQNRNCKFTSLNWKFYTRRETVDFYSEIKIFLDQNTQYKTNICRYYIYKALFWERISKINIAIETFTAKDKRPRSTVINYQCETCSI